MSGYQNVQESFPLYDTMLITGMLDDLSKKPEQWFSTFNAAGQANEWNFFNIRNSASAGLPYNNQDTRDQLAWAFLLDGLNVSFIGPQIADHVSNTALPEVREFTHNAIWQNEIPRHCGLELKINQDVRLEIASLMPGSGSGPVGGGYGPLDLSQGDHQQNPIHSFHSQGPANNGTKFYFPTQIQIPRKTSISVTIKPNEYARRMLQTLGGPYHYNFTDTNSDPYYPYVAFGIRIMLSGSRLVQQRGELHA